MQLSVTPNDRIPYKIVYQDDDLAIIFKPAGVVTQPGVKHQHNSLLNGLFSVWGQRLQQLGKRRDYGLLHRLDRGTSGLLAIGLSIEGYDGLRTAFTERRVTKNYLAIVDGPFKRKTGTCRVPIAEQRKMGRKKAIVASDPSHHKFNAHSMHDAHQKRDFKKIKSRSFKSIKDPQGNFKKKQEKLKYSQGKSKKLQARSQSSQARSQSSQATPKTHSANPLHFQTAITHFQTLNQGHSASVLRCTLETGRLHQIRAHMAYLGHPVVGDFEYGGKRAMNVLMRSISRDTLALHSGSLQFKHPVTGEPIYFEYPPDEPILSLLDSLNVSTTWPSAIIRKGSNA